MMYRATYAPGVLPGAARARARAVPRVAAAIAGARRTRCREAATPPSSTTACARRGSQLTVKVRRLARDTRAGGHHPPVLTQQAAADPDGSAMTSGLATATLVRIGRADEPNLRPAGPGVLSDQPLQQPLRVVRLVEVERRRRSEPRGDRRARRVAARARRAPRGVLGRRAAAGQTCSRRRRLFRANGLTLHLLTSGVLLEKCAAEVASRVLAGHRVARRLDRSALPRDQARSALGLVEKGVARLRRLAPAVPVTARATLHRMNFRELPRLIDHARAMALDGISFLAADVSSSAFGRSGAPARLAVSCSIAEEIEEFSAIVERTIIDRASDFESGFIAESPAKLRRLPPLRDALLHGRAVCAARLQRALDVGGGRSERRRSSLLLSAPIGSMLEAPLAICVANELPRFRQTLDVGPTRCAAVRVLDEGRLEEPAVAVTVAWRHAARVRRRGGGLSPLQCRERAVAACGAVRSTRCCATCRAGRMCSISAAVPAPMPSAGRPRLR